MKKIKEFLKKIQRNQNLICDSMALFFGFLTQLLVIAILFGLVYKVNKLDYNEEQQASEPVQSERLALDNESEVSLDSFYNVKQLQKNEINNYLSNSYVQINMREITNEMVGEYLYSYGASGEVIKGAGVYAHVEDYPSLINFGLNLKITKGLRPVDNKIILTRFYFNYLEDNTIETINIFTYDSISDIYTFNSSSLDYYFNINKLTRYNDLQACMQENVEGGLIYSLLNRTLGENQIKYDMSEFNPAFGLSYAVNSYNTFINPLAGQSARYTLEIKTYFKVGDMLCDSYKFTFEGVGYTADNNGNITKWNNYDGATSNGNAFMLYTSVYVHPVGLYVNDNEVIYQIAERPILTYQQYDTLNEATPVWLCHYAMRFLTEDYKYIVLNSADLGEKNIQGFLNHNYPAKGLTLYEFLNMQGEYVSNTMGGISVGLENVFTLIGSSFSGLIPLLNITIVPGITIGLLVFIPLIITIILVILRLVKK